MEKRIIVVGIVTDVDKVLLGKKAKGRPPYPDVWHTIGGGVEDVSRAENLIKAGKYDDPYLHEELGREIREESGIEIKNIRNICPKFRNKPREDITMGKHGKDTHFIFLEYLCELDSGEPKPADDIAELQWVKRCDLDKVKLTLPSTQMYKELGWIK